MTARRLLIVSLIGSIVVAFIATRSTCAQVKYPAHWWAAVPREGAPSWEILPQEAGPGEVIVSKRHELGLLSNLAATAFVFRGVRYASLEGFWQMMLYPESPADPRATFPGLEWPHTRDQVAQMTGFEAKDAGTLAERNMERMGIDWVSFEGRRFPYRPEQPGKHYALIVTATREKVRQNPDVKKVLLATGILILRPDHQEEAGARAAWHYCDILMHIRDELRRRGIGGSGGGFRGRDAVLQLFFLPPLGNFTIADPLKLGGTEPGLGSPVPPAAGILIFQLNKVKSKRQVDWRASYGPRTAASRSREVVEAARTAGAAAAPRHAQSVSRLRFGCREIVPDAR